MAGEIRIDLRELKDLPDKLYAVSVKAAQKGLARTLRETIRATRKAAIDATRAANVVKLTPSEFKTGANEKLVSKRPADSASYEVRQRGPFGYFVSHVSKSSTQIMDAFATFRVSNFKINLFRFFAKRVRVVTASGNARRVVNIAKGNAQPVFRTFRPKTYGTRVTVLGKSSIAKGGFILRRGRAGIILRRLTGVRSAERRPWGRKLWGPSMETITDGKNVNRVAAAKGLETFAKRILGNLEFYAKQSLGKR